MDKTQKKTVVRELVEMRTGSRKAFEMSDGTKQMIVCPKAEDFKEVDNSLVINEADKHYINKKNRFIARFSNDDTNDELFAIENGIYRVGVSAKKAHKTAPNRVKPVHFGKTEADSSEDKLVFGNILDAVDYEYSVNGCGIKENIIIKKKAELYRYSFELTCTNVNAVYDEADKCVIFRDAETCDEVFTIPSPFMVDSDGAVSTAVSYEMRPTNAGKLMLTIIANEDWINAEERAFPVTIDPQITLAQKNSFDSYSYMSGTVSAGVLPIVGTYLSNGVVSVNRMYISFDNLNIPRNIKIKNASLKLYQFGEDVTETAELPKICICDAQGIAVASGSTITDVLGCALDYDILKTAATSDEDVISYTFDITQFLNAASNNDLANSTLAVKLVDESYTENNYVAFYGCSGVKNYPEITVTYETDYSVNSSAAVHTHELGRFGTGMIDLRYGNLMFESEDFAWAGNRMPVTIKHIYNSALAGYQYTNNSAIELHAANFSAMNVGYGWRLNLMQSMVSANVTHDGVTRDGYIYVDENGAETGFIPVGDVYEDVDGAGMTYSASTRELKIGSETYTFDTEGRLIRIADEYNNAIVITYTDGRITTVTDGAGRDFLLSYSSADDLMSITAPDNSIISYTYTEGILETIAYPDECKAVITTSAANEITSVDICNDENISLYKVYYDYNNGNVVSVEEKGTSIVNGTATSEFGMCTEYAYSAGTNRTTVSTIEPSDPDAGEVTDNVVETVYTFDNDGNIISRYVYTDAAGHIGIDGEAGGIYPHGADGGVNIAANVVNLLTKTNPADWSNISASTSLDVP